MPTPSYGLSSLKNAPLPQRFAGLPERCAARRAFGTQKAQKRFEISPNFSRQGYASDFRSRQTFLTTSASLAGEVRHMKQMLPCCVALVLLRVKSTHLQCTISPKKRQNYESIAANLSDESQRRRGTARCRRHQGAPQTRLPPALALWGWVRRAPQQCEGYMAEPLARRRKPLVPGEVVPQGAGSTPGALAWRGHPQLGAATRQERTLAAGGCKALFGMVPASCASDSRVPCVPIGSPHLPEGARRGAS